MKLIVTGGTGFAGGEVLKQGLRDDRIESVMHLARRSSGITDPKLTEVVVRDFLDYSAVNFGDFDACIWCLGVSQTQVNEQDYIKITHDYAIAAATAMFVANPKLRFCFVSGRSSDQDEKAKSLQGRIKGRTEKHLLDLNGDVYIFRPGYIRATAQSGPRKDFARFFAPVGALIGLFVNDFSVDCDQLARCLLAVARNGSADHLFDNSAILKWNDT